MVYHFYLKEQKMKKEKSSFANFYDKNEYVIHIKNLNQALNKRVVLKKVDRVIKLNKRAWLNNILV